MQVHIWKHDDYNIDGWLESLPVEFDTRGTVVYKGRNIIKRMTTPNGIDVVVKEYRRSNLLQRLVYSSWRMNKGLRAYTNANEMLRRGIKTPKPIACVEERAGGVYQRSWYVYEYCPAMPLVQLDMQDKTLLKSLAKYTVELHRSGLLHNDFNVGNILCSDASGRWDFTLIDINRMSFTPIGIIPSLRRCINTMLRLPPEWLDFKFFITQYLTLSGFYSERKMKEVMAKKNHHDKLYRLKKKICHPFR